MPVDIGRRAVPRDRCEPFVGQVRRVVELYDCCKQAGCQPDCGRSASEFAIGRDRSDRIRATNAYYIVYTDELVQFAGCCFISGVARWGSDRTPGVTKLGWGSTEPGNYRPTLFTGERAGERDSFSPAPRFTAV